MKEKIRRQLSEQGKELTYRPAVLHENKGGNLGIHPFSCALRANGSYNYLTVNGERRLTPREMFRLQGFPDSIKIVVPDTQARKQAGNSVVVPKIQAVAKAMIEAMSKKPLITPSTEPIPATLFSTEERPQKVYAHK